MRSLHVNICAVLRFAVVPNAARMLLLVKRIVQNMVAKISNVFG